MCLLADVQPFGRKIRPFELLKTKNADCCGSPRYQKQVGKVLKSTIPPWDKVETTVFELVAID
jgi:hypothetical protein